MSILWERKNEKMKGGTRSWAAEEMDQLSRDIKSRQEGTEKRDWQRGDTYLNQTC